MIDDQILFLATGYRTLDDAPAPPDERASYRELSRYRSLLALSAQSSLTESLLGQALEVTDPDLLRPLREQFDSVARNLQQRARAENRSPGSGGAPQEPDRIRFEGHQRLPSPRERASAHRAPAGVPRAQSPPGDGACGRRGGDRGGRPRTGFGGGGRFGVGDPARPRPPPDPQRDRHRGPGAHRLAARRPGAGAPHHEPRRIDAADGGGRPRDLGGRRGTRRGDRHGGRPRGLPPARPRGPAAQPGGDAGRGGAGQERRARGGADRPSPRPGPGGPPGEAGRPRPVDGRGRPRDQEPAQLHQELLRDLARAHRGDEGDPRRLRGEARREDPRGAGRRHRGARHEPRQDRRAQPAGGQHRAGACSRTRASPPATSSRST